jgi:hypothetical protein
MKQQPMQVSDDHEKRYWRRWYAAVLIFLLLQILLYTAITNWFQ